MSSDDSVLVSGSEDNTARVWSIEDEEPVEDLEDLDELFDEDTEKKKNEEENDEEETKNDTTEVVKDDEDTKSVQKEEIKDDTLSQKSQGDEDDVEEVLNIDAEDNETDKGQEEDAVSTNETKNEGEKRCLGVLR